MLELSALRRLWFSKRALLLHTIESTRSFLEDQVEANFRDHDLGSFKIAGTVTGSFQAECRQCSQTVWVGPEGQMYSLLGDRVLLPPPGRPLLTTPLHNQGPDRGNGRADPPRAPG